VSLRRRSSALAARLRRHHDRRPADIWVALAYVLLRAGNFHWNVTVAGGDSALYRAVSQRSLLDPDFYTGRYPPGTPLLWKLLPGDHLPAIGQLALSTVSWAVLAWVVASFFAGRMRYVALVSVLSFSLVTHVVAWDGLLLSESLALSAFALVLACWFTLARRPSWRAVTVLLAATTVFVFTRDSNAYLALMTVPALAVWAARSRRRALPLVALGGTCLLFAASVALEQESKRNLVPVDHVVARLLANEDSRRWLYAHGMPLRHAPGYDEWLERHGARTYVEYAVTHPRYAVAEPFDELERWLAPNVSQDVTIAREVLPRPVEEILNPSDIGRLAFWIVIVGICAALAVARAAPRAIWAVPALTFALSIPHGMLVWLGDTLNLERHAVPAALQARLGLILCLLFALDALHRRPTRMRW
jgi:hypothetical protein